jgi:hypothetical protein
MNIRNRLSTICAGTIPGGVALPQLQGVNGGPVRAAGILVNCPAISRHE